MSPIRPPVFNYAGHSGWIRIRQRPTSVFCQSFRRFITCHEDDRGHPPPSIDSLSFARLTEHALPRRRGKRRFTVPKSIDEGLVDGPPIAVFPDPTDIATSTGNIHLQPEDVQYIGSYNWVDSRKPTIIVPGSPRIYRDHEPPYSVPLHHGGAFVDENGHRMKSRALTPLLAAVDVTVASSGNQPFDWTSVDLVTDRGNLRRLFAFLGGRWHLKEFRIDVQLAGAKSLLFTRWEPKTERHCWKGDCWAHSFEVARTEAAPGCEYGLSHHRIITYSYDGLKIVIRFEVDAFRPFEDDTSPNLFLAPREDLHLETDQRPLPNMSYLYPSLQILRGGGMVPQGHLLELKTTSAKRSNVKWARVVPQLYFSQTNHLILAMHSEGNFHRMRVESLASEPVRNRLQLQEADYRKLGPLLRAIRDVVVARGPDARLSLVGVRGRGLEIRERKSSRSCLPKEVLRRFESGGT